MPDLDAEELIPEGTSCRCLETTWNCLFGFLRSIPLLALIAFGVDLAAFIMVKFGAQTVIEGSNQLGYDTSTYVSYVWQLFLLMVIVNAIALAIGICSTGKCEELLFVENIEDKVDRLCCFRCLGCCSEYSFEFVVMPLVDLLLWVVFFLALVLSYVFLIIYGLFILVSYVCRNQDDVASTLSAALNTVLINFFPSLNLDTGLPKFCAKAKSAGTLFAISPHTLQGAGLWLYLGCLFAAIAQVLQLVAMQGEWQRIYAAMFEARTKNEEVSPVRTYKKEEVSQGRTTAKTQNEAVSLVRSYIKEEVSQGRTYGSIDPASCSREIDLA